MNAWPIMLRMRRQGYSRTYLARWLDAIRWLRAQDRWILDKQVRVTEQRRK